MSPWMTSLLMPSPGRKNVWSLPTVWTCTAVSGGKLPFSSCVFSVDLPVDFPVFFEDPAAEEDDVGLSTIVWIRRFQSE